MTKKERYEAVINWFTLHMKDAKTELHYQSTFELLVAVILSAQCTDKRINLVTPELFKAFPDPYTLAASSPEVVYPYIRSVTYPNNKAKSLVGMAQKLVEDFNGEVPSSLDEMMTLPGVGRKTANVIGSVVFNKAVIAVDTHVFRVAERLGLTSGSTSPLQTEKELTKHIPAALRAKAHHWLILHGRYVCMARKPKCERCGLAPFCIYYSKHPIV